MSQRYKAVKKNVIRKFALLIRRVFFQMQLSWYKKFYKMDLHPSCKFSLKVNFDKTNPKGIHVGAETYIAFGVVVLAHDMSRGFHADTHIGSRCFIGAHAIIMPGVRIGDSCVIGAGSVVTKNIPSNCIAAGNPVKILKEGIRTEAMGKLVIN